MTAFLASVRSAGEARLVLDAGADVLDVKEPDAGALGAVSDVTLREIVICANGAVPVSATIGDLPMESEYLVAAIERTWQAGVDIVKVGVFTDAISESVLSTLTGCSSQGIRIVLVCFAEHWRGDLNYEFLQQAGIRGVMLDTRDKYSGSLTSKLDRTQLQDFARHAQRARLIAGLAGSLEENDIPVLCEIAPDYLGFRGALCGSAGRTAAIDPVAVRRIAHRIHTGGPRRTVLARRSDPMDSTILMPV